LARASAPLLAVFLLGMLLLLLTASSMLRAGYELETRELILKQASLTANSILKSVESELNSYLYWASSSVMYEVGWEEGSENEVVEGILTRAMMLENAWKFSNVQLELHLENLREFLHWLPDGSLEIRGFLPASAKHVMGPEAFGLRLEVSGLPRFRRLHQLALRLSELHLTPNLIERLNENLRAEGLQVEVLGGTMIIRDLWAHPVLVKR